MKQLELFQQENQQDTYRSKSTGKLWIIQSRCNTICRCERYPRPHYEKDLDITYYVEFNDLEKVN